MIKIHEPVYAGRGHDGYLVYLSYQLVDHVTFQQVIGETILYSSDIRYFIIEPFLTSLSFLSFFLCISCLKQTKELNPQLL